MKLSVIIVNYNVRYYLSQCLDSVKRATQGIEAELIVVDNHSIDHSVSAIRRNHPEVTLIENMHNVGFARANNIGIRQSTGEYVLLLNPDTIVGEDTLNEVITFMDAHPDSGALGVRMLNADGTKAMESRRGIPSPRTSFGKMSGLGKHFPQKRQLGKYYMSYLPWDSEQEIEIVSGAFCLLRRKALNEIGLLDEQFFMYGEDIDLSYRLLKGGYHNWYHPATILHYKGESTQKSSFRYVHVFYQAMHIFFKKHYGQLNLFITLPIIIAIYFKALIALVSMLTQRMKKSLGFSVSASSTPPHYLFLKGSSESEDAIKKIIQRRGLDAFFVEQFPQQLPPHTIIVFDATSLAYKEMLTQLEKLSASDVRIGIYHHSMNVIITPSEIIS